MRAIRFGMYVPVGEDENAGTERRKASASECSVATVGLGVATSFSTFILLFVPF